MHEKTRCKELKLKDELSKARVSSQNSAAFFISCFCFLRLLFWAQCGSSSKIERASLDGQDRMALVTYLISHPVALSLGMFWNLTVVQWVWDLKVVWKSHRVSGSYFYMISLNFCLDMPRRLLYWVDRGTKTISRVDLEGRHRKTVVESNGYLDRPFGLAVFEVKNTHTHMHTTVLTLNLKLRFFTSLILFHTYDSDTGQNLDIRGVLAKLLNDWLTTNTDFYHSTPSQKHPCAWWTGGNHLRKRKMQEENVKSAC